MITLSNFAKVAVDFNALHNHKLGDGLYVVDQPAGKALEHYTFKNFGKYHFLQRFDLGKVYEIHDSHCESRAINGTHMRPLWNWLKTAQYEGQRDFKHRKFDIWGEDFGHGFKVEIGVFANSIDRPAVLVQKFKSDENVYEFFSWNTTKPAASVFDVPA
eukprot:CAMPEP_0168606370 /NCGR_PEP_ID=MMETSP0420-20121227/16533_1 /TAXON_ID=498008 /ORGANISM="Pessonella sp." /LENGTH=158 /DNA_ID=CAMNT_0008646027 /DNA_START=605 /DNA_END=1077 /DNA_ORIENTATION=+